jgi:hypothetical protein
MGLHSQAVMGIAIPAQPAEGPCSRGCPVKKIAISAQLLEG